MKKYEISFDISVNDMTLNYDVKKVIKVNVQENLPVNVDPEQYIRSRLAEEVKRQFKNLADEIDNKTEDFDSLEGK